ncbi:surfeit locus 1 [Sulfuricella denitrificans skB26]|uniref:SURF1-like protein n=2 Tax=Sulfuricella denitrificans TaxID=649841 RepID=S6AJE4_SULDS|nr:surfeit locus 1 [Sulfuricella denitrificans skB26]
MVVLLLLPALISLGQWQARKAGQKQALQETYDQREKGSSLQVGANLLNPETVRYSRVVARGRYETAYQILLDNQVHDEMAGYHVLTPLHIEGGNMRVLVNRGWVPVGRDRNVLPATDVPQGVVEVSGYAAVPSGKFFELEKPEDLRSGWQKVWQNLDLKRYTDAVPFPLQPLVIRLDPASTAGGYVREWPRPDSRIEVHRGYALQWYGMAAVLVVFYLVTSFRKAANDDHEHA